MQGLFHAELIKIIEPHTLPFMTGRDKTTTHSSQTRADGDEERPTLGNTSPYTTLLPVPAPCPASSWRTQKATCELGQPTGDCHQRRRGLATSTAGLWTTGSLRARAVQGMRRFRRAGVTLQWTKKQQYRIFQLTQSIYAHQITAFG